MPKGYPHHIDEPMGYVPPPKAEPVITFDDVEDEDWFQRLPPAARQEYRDRWAKSDARRGERRTFARTTRTRSMVQGALVFLFTETCCAMPSWGHSIAGVIVGAAVGAVWHHMSADRFRCIATAVVPYAALRIAFPGESMMATCIFAVLGFPMLLGLTAMVGWVRERRRADDQDY